MTQNEKHRLRAKAEAAADDSKFAWNYAKRPNTDPDYKEELFREAEFLLKLSNTYSEILKGCKEDEL